MDMVVQFYTFIRTCWTVCFRFYCVCITIQLKTESIKGNKTIKAKDWVWGTDREGKDGGNFTTGLVTLSKL